MYIFILDNPTIIIDILVSINIMSVTIQVNITKEINIKKIY